MKLSDMTEDDLRRKADQESEMASLALADNDPQDAERHLKKEKLYVAELLRRKG